MTISHSVSQLERLLTDKNEPPTQSVYGFMILHIINQSPLQASAFNDCLRIYRQGDSILLIEDGVYAAVDCSASGQSIQASNAIIYALKADVLARGLQNKLIAQAQLASDDLFVELVAKHQLIQSWY